MKSSLREAFEQHLRAGLKAHHFAWMMEDPDNKGPKGGKLFIYVCSCGDGFSDRKNLMLHQLDMLKL